MRLIERGIEYFNELSPQRQKAIEYFIWSGFGAAVSGVSAVPVFEMGAPANGIGLIGLVGGAAISIVEFNWGREAWQAGSHNVN